MDNRSLANFSVRVHVEQWLPEAAFKDFMKVLGKHKGFVGELAFFSSSIHPAIPLQTVKERAGVLKGRIATAKAAGYGAGVNVLNTIGHIDEYCAQALKGDFTPLTGPDGKRMEACFCPNDPKFIAFNREVYKEFAQTGAGFLWVDDDLRLGGHGSVRFACFCERCLEGFGKGCGRSFTRESLLEAFKTGSEAAQLQLRKAWLKHNAEILTRLLSEIEKAVHGVDPSIELGLMTCEMLYEPGIPGI